MTQVTMQGNPLNLSGKEVKIGSAAPDFEVVDNNLKPLKLSQFKGKAILIASVPSIDTSVCSTETRKFNEALGKIGSSLVGLTISMDLPFAQKRYCAAEGINNIQTASDHRSADFGQKYGVLIPDLRLLARAIFLIDQNGVLRYSHLVKEVTQEPPYDEVLKEVNKLLAGTK